MATSSITHNFVVSNPNSVKRFVAAIDEADRDRTPKQTLPGRQLTNPQEILALMSKRKKKKRQFPEIRNVNQTVAFLCSKSNKFQKLMQSVWLIILRSGNTSIKWLETILCIKAQKKFIIFAFKKLHNAA